MKKPEMPPIKKSPQKIFTVIGIQHEGVVCKKPIKADFLPLAAPLLVELLKVHAFLDLQEM